MAGVARLWAEIAAARYAAGQLWLPQLNLDLIGNEYALMELPAPVWFSKEKSVATGVDQTAWFTLTTLYFYVPDFVMDITFGDMRVYAQLYFQTKLSSSGSYNIKIGEGAESGSLTNTAYAAALFTGWTAAGGAVASGRLTIPVYARSGGSRTVYFQKALTDRYADEEYLHLGTYS